jgi:hypothetical protein
LPPPLAAKLASPFEHIEEKARSGANLVVPAEA